jgi:hypothetical protein
MLADVKIRGEILGKYYQDVLAREGVVVENDRRIYGFKVIAVDNYDRELYSDFTVVTGVKKEDGETIANFLNSSPLHSGDWFYKCVESDYVLYKCDPE